MPFYVMYNLDMPFFNNVKNKRQSRSGCSTNFTSVSDWLYMCKHIHVCMYISILVCFPLPLTDFIY